MKDGKYELSDIRIVKLSKVYSLIDFNCGDKDLNDFLKNDALGYQDNKIVNTLLLIHQEKVVGFFSLCTDAIKLLEEEKKDSYIYKPLREYPAIKIARLAVDKAYQGRSLGRIIMQLAIGIIRHDIANIVACRFITVDAYADKVDFYKKFGFIENEDRHYKKKENYVSMRFDLVNPPDKE